MTGKEVAQGQQPGRKKRNACGRGKHPALSGTLTPIHGWSVSIRPSPSAPDSRGIQMMAEGQRSNCPRHACRTGSHTPFAQRLQTRVLSTHLDEVLFSTAFMWSEPHGLILSFFFFQKQGRNLFCGHFWVRALAENIVFKFHRRM